MDSSSQFYSSTNSNPMGEAVRNERTSARSREMEKLSLEMSKYPRDLLQLGTNQSSSSSVGRFGEPRIGGEGDGDEDDDGLNLGLGLSLGGKFGVDKPHKGLKRSSSIIGTMPLLREEVQVERAPATAVHTLARTASLPLETEEAWRKRKEMQTLRRMEAKRRRSEKQRILKEGGGSEGGGEEKGVKSVSFRGRLDRGQQNLGIANKVVGGSSMGNPFGTSSPKVEVRRRRTTFGSLQGFLMAQAQAQAQVGSQGSGESQGGSSSGASELESRTYQGSSSCGEDRSPASIHSTQERATQDLMGPTGTKPESSQRSSSGPEAEGSLKPPEGTDHKRRELGGGAGMEDMPCVFTIGDGPHGRKVEGILYKYGKGEDVRIMCICHGSFFSPAEFVKHAGGQDVEHPLRHIVVSPSPSAIQ